MISEEQQFSLGQLWGQMNGTSLLIMLNSPSGRLVSSSHWIINLEHCLILVLHLYTSLDQISWVERFQGVYPFHISIWHHGDEFITLYSYSALHGKSFWLYEAVQALPQNLFLLLHRLHSWMVWTSLSVLSLGAQHDPVLRLYMETLLMKSLIDSRYFLQFIKAYLI